MELLEIEKDLAGENRMEAMERYDAVLLALSRRLEEALRRGVPPEEYAKCEELREATTVARKLLRLQVKDAEKTGF